MPGTARAADSTALARGQNLGGGFERIGAVEIGMALRQLGRVGEAAIGILRHRPRHRDRALDQGVERGAAEIGAEIGSRDHRLSPPDKDAQAEVPTLLALQFFRLTEALCDRDADALHMQRIGCIGAGAARRSNQIGKEVEIGHPKTALRQRSRWTIKALQGTAEDATPDRSFGRPPKPHA